MMRQIQLRRTTKEELMANPLWIAGVLNADSSYFLCAPGCVTLCLRPASFN